MRSERPLCITREHRVPPDGCIDLVFSRDEGASRPDLWLVGTMTRPRIVALRGTVDYAGLRFRPGGFHCLFGLPAYELTDRMVRLEDILGSAARQLVQRLADHGDYQTRMAILEQFLQSLHPIAPHAIVFDAIERILASAGNLRVASLRDADNRGSRQMRRHFHRWVGVGPKTFSRVIRFQAALRRLRDGDGDLLGTALDSGYYDQAHFIHEFESFFGKTPSDFLRNRG